MDKSDYVRQIFESGRKLRQLHERRWRTGSADQVHQPWVSLNLTMAQLRTLFLIWQSTAATPRDLAEAMKVSPANVTGIIERLVQQNLVVRRRSTTDRRVLLLKLTPEAEKLLAEVREARNSMQERLMKRLPETLLRMSDEDLAALAQGLAGFAAAVETEEVAGGDGGSGNGSSEPDIPEGRERNSE